MSTQSEPASFTEAWLTGPGSHQFYTRTWSPPPSAESPAPRAIIVFAHGFAEHVGRYEFAFPAFAKRGVSLVAFDQRGFGRTALDVEKRSKDAAFGKTSWARQLGDLEWLVKWVREKNPGVPVFLMGHSMGGGLCCAFATRTTAPPSPETVKLVSGVILCSPLIQLTHRKPKVVMFAGGQLGRLFPSMSIPAGVNPDHLSRNPPRNEAYMKDPLIQQTGTLKGLDDMLSGGERLLENDWQHWPKSLPALFLHGTADQVSSSKATEALYNKIPAEDKKLVLYPGAYHEMFQEIEDIPEKMANEITSWIEAHVASSGTAAVEAKL